MLSSKVPCSWFRVSGLGFRELQKLQGPGNPPEATSLALNLNPKLCRLGVRCPGNIFSLE